MNIEDVVTPSGEKLAIGQTWKEMDNRFDRYVTVAGWNPDTQKVQLKSGSRLTWASLKRFNGKSMGYKLQST